MLSIKTSWINSANTQYKNLIKNFHSSKVSVQFFYSLGHIERRWIVSDRIPYCLSNRTLSYPLFTENLHKLSSICIKLFTNHMIGIYFLSHITPFLKAWMLFLELCKIKININKSLMNLLFLGLFKIKRWKYR